MKRKQSLGDEKKSGFCSLPVCASCMCTSVEATSPNPYPYVWLEFGGNGLFFNPEWNRKVIPICVFFYFFY